MQEEMGAETVFERDFAFYRQEQENDSHALTYSAEDERGHDRRPLYAAAEPAKFGDGGKEQWYITGIAKDDAAGENCAEVESTAVQGPSSLWREKNKGVARDAGRGLTASKPPNPISSDGAWTCPLCHSRNLGQSSVCHRCYASIAEYGFSPSFSSPSAFASPSVHTALPPPPHGSFMPPQMAVYPHFFSEKGLDGHMDVQDGLHLASTAGDRGYHYADHSSLSANVQYLSASLPPHPGHPHAPRHFYSHFTHSPASSGGQRGYGATMNGAQQQRGSHRQANNSSRSNGTSRSGNNGNNGASSYGGSGYNNSASSSNSSNERRSSGGSANDEDGEKISNGTSSAVDRKESTTTSGDSDSIKAVGVPGRKRGYQGAGNGNQYRNNAMSAHHTMPRVQPHYKQNGPSKTSGRTFTRPVHVTHTTAFHRPHGGMVPNRFHRGPQPLQTAPFNSYGSWGRWPGNAMGPYRTPRGGPRGPSRNVPRGPAPPGAFPPRPFARPRAAPVPPRQRFTSVYVPVKTKQENEAATLAAPDKSVNDWYCSRCRGHNYSTRTRCRKCGVVKRGPVPQWQVKQSEAGSTESSEEPATKEDKRDPMDLVGDEEGQRDSGN